MLTLLPPAVLRLEPDPGPAGRPRLLFDLAAPADLVGLGAAAALLIALVFHVVPTDAGEQFDF